MRKYHVKPTLMLEAEQGHIQFPCLNFCHQVNASDDIDSWSSLMLRMEIETPN